MLLFKFSPGTCCYFQKKDAVLTSNFAEWFFLHDTKRKLNEVLITMVKKQQILLNSSQVSYPICLSLKTSFYSVCDAAFKPRKQFPKSTGWG